jgi:hypothetical protein
MMKLKFALASLFFLLLPTHIGATGPKKPTPPCDVTENTAYDAKIKEYTTEPFFLTDLVDHLPLSSCVPPPDVHLGHIVGAPDYLTYSKDINAYMRLLAGKSPRVKVFDMGLSEEGREMLLVAISDEKTIALLDHYREINARLADPRKLTDTEAEKLVRQAKPIYWVTGGMHAPEAGAPEMMMELAYRLTVEESPLIQRIRQNSIILLTPILDVDGHDRDVDLYHWNKNHPRETPKPLVWWGHYVAHDSNRDALVLSLALSRSVMEMFLKFHPQVLHDLHEPVAYLAIGPDAGFYDVWLDPIVINERKQMSLHELDELTKRGVPGIKTTLEGLGPFTLISIAEAENAIGRYYETWGFQGANTASTLVFHPTFPEEQMWARPDPPLPKVKWSLRNNVNLAQSALLLGMDNVATHVQLFMRNFLLKSRRSVQKPYNEGPAAYVFPADDPRTAEQARLLNLLKRHGVEVKRLQTETTADAITFPAGSYLVRMDQPYSRMADIMLDVGYYNSKDPYPYDETGWTLPALRNVKAVRVKDVTMLSAPMDKVEGEVRVTSSVDGSGHTYLINHTTDNNLATLRFQLADVKMDAAEQPFEVDGREFRAGTFIIRAADRTRLAAVATELGVNVYTTDAQIKVSTHPLSAPRIALVHNWDWIGTSSDGWVRLAFDNLKIPYTYLADTRLAEMPRIRDKFDVVILPQGSVHEKIRDLFRSGMAKGTPISWTNTIETPNLVTGGLDSTDDIRGGLGLGGVLKLEKFVSDGGLLITITSSVSLPVEAGIAEVNVTQPRNLEVLGSVLKTQFDDKSSPIAYGYDDTLAVHYASWFNCPVLGFPRDLAPRSPTPVERGSGRGGLTDPDVVQGRPLYSPRLDETQPARASTSTAEPSPRIVLRYASESELLISGSLKGGSELADTGAVVDAPHGKGHVVLFASNPFWREETQGSFFLVFNAIFNYDHLDAGRDSGK